MKVLHLISTSVFSGAENVACQIINMFKQDKNIEMYYVAVLGDNESVLKDRNIEYIELKKFNLKSIKSIVNKYKPDIIHAHDIRASFYASFFSNKTTIISHVHNNHEDMRKLDIKTILYNFVSKKFSKIIWVSKSALDSYYFKKRIIDKSIVLYNVINEEEILKKSEIDNNKYDFDLVFLGRLTYQKNPERLIEIANSIVKNNNSFKLAIIGDGELKEEIQSLIKEYNLEENVKLLGFMKNPYKVLKDSKMLILTSRFEGTPMVALESMALGVPIVSTYTDGMVDIISSDENGFLCNSNEDFVKSINEILKDSTKLKSLKKKTIEKSKMVNSLGNYKEEIKKIYNIK